MKRLSLKSLTLLLALSMVITTLALSSCKSLDPAIVASATSSASAATHTHDTLILRDTLYRHDSVIYRERTIHDTVYVTKEVYRDALNSKFKIQNSTKTDTLVVTEWREKVIEYPPERYIPPFYKRCTLFFWLILATCALYMIGKIYLKRRL